SIGQDARDVEQLERNPDLEANAVRAPEQLDNEDDLPNQRQAGTGGRGEIGRELRQYDVAQARPCPHAKHLRHVVESVIERASVAPRLKASAPERPSSRTASATACGSGSRRAPANCEPAYQTAMSSASETSLAPTFTPQRPAGRRFQRRARVPARRAPRRRSRRARDTEPVHPPPPRRAAGARCLRRSVGGRSQARS